MVDQMSVAEARALVELCGGAAGEPGSRIGNQALHGLYAQLGRYQRVVFDARMNLLWPKPQRRTLLRPIDVNGQPTQIASWNDAWAIALAQASQVRREV